MKLKLITPAIVAAITLGATATHAFASTTTPPVDNQQPPAGWVQVAHGSNYTAYQPGPNAPRQFINKLSSAAMSPMDTQTLYQGEQGGSFDYGTASYYNGDEQDTITNMIATFASNGLQIWAFGNVTGDNSNKSTGAPINCSEILVQPSQTVNIGGVALGVSWPLGVSASGSSNSGTITYPQVPFNNTYTGTDYWSQWSVKIPQNITQWFGSIATHDVSAFKFGSSSAYSLSADMDIDCASGAGI